MKKRTQPTGLSPILKAMSKELGLEKGLAFYRLKSTWPDLVGQTIASHTHPEKIRFSTLTLRVDGAAWMHELNFLKEELLQKINRKLGKKPEATMIRTLHLKLGQLPKSARFATSDSRSRRKKLSSEEASLIQQNIASISNQALKHAIEKAMKQHLLLKGSSASGDQVFQ